MDSEEELEQNLDKIRRDGFYKTITGKGQVAAIAVPVNIQSQGALGCYAPLFRCDENHTMEIVSLLKEAAKKIEQETNTQF